MNEGDELAHIAYDFLMLRSGYQRSNYKSEQLDDYVIEPDIRAWTKNIHTNIWGTNSLDARVKARVVILRIRGTDA